MSILNNRAPRPPMGWNNWISYACSVVEEEVKAHADYMAGHLLPFGYEYVVMDACWYSPLPPEQGTCLDSYGRPLPEETRFPSAAGGRGFAPLADYCHRKKLKFGLHLMRGIPIDAVKRNLPILGSDRRAADIAAPDRPTGWSTGMYSIDMSKPGAQAYYYSVVALCASWGVDFIKYDDMVGFKKLYGRTLIPFSQSAEVEAVSKAIGKTEHSISLSISPGEALPDFAPHMRKWVEMERISGDFWDTWAELKYQFELCAPWAEYVGNGFWPDADMLPLGRIALRFDESSGRGPDRDTRFTPDEQRTLMTLWCIFRSPLMMGGDLTRMDAATFKLLTNPEVLAVDQNSTGNRELFRRGDHVAWSAKDPDSGDAYLAVFNLTDQGPTEIPVELSLLELRGDCRVRDLWARKEIGTVKGAFTPAVPSHGAALFSIRP